MAATRTKRRKTTTGGKAKPKSAKARPRSAKAPPKNPKAGAKRTKTAVKRPKATSATRKKTKRTAATRQPAARRSTTDIITMLEKDHREVETMFRRYERLHAGAVKERRAVVDDVTKELSRHAAVEEQILYPTVQREVPGGARLAKEGIAEHQTMKEILAALEYGSSDSALFDERVDALMKDVRHHIKEEEDELFPKLRSRVSKATLVQMGKLVEIAKKAAPTRPHPHLPTTPPANIVTGVAAGVVDRVRDAGRQLVHHE